MDGILHPMVQAAKRELEVLQEETGHTAWNPHPEFVAAKRVYLAVLEVACWASHEASIIRSGKAKLRVVK